MNKPKTTPKDFFLWLGAMVALYASVVAVIILLFEYINVLFPDQLDFYRDPFSGAIRGSMATLIVMFPLYIYLTRKLNQDIRKNPEKKELWIRRWLLHLTVFGAGATLIIDLITLINTFLGGDLTARFLLKVLSILVVAGWIFFYYLHDVRGRWEKEKKKSERLGWLAGAFVLAVIVAGFIIVGTPGEQRDLRFDRERVMDLQNIQWQVVNFWQDKERLPGNLSELEDPLRGFDIPGDPETGEPYVYNIIDELTFELCADFVVPSPGLSNAPKSASANGFAVPRPAFDRSLAFPEGGNWEHDAGEECFERTIDPERFPPRKPQLP